MPGYAGCLWRSHIDFTFHLICWNDYLQNNYNEISWRHMPKRTEESKINADSLLPVNPCWCLKRHSFLQMLIGISFSCRAEKSQHPQHSEMVAIETKPNERTCDDWARIYGRESSFLFQLLPNVWYILMRSARHCDCACDIPFLLLALRTICRIAFLYLGNAYVLLRSYTTYLSHSTACLSSSQIKLCSTAKENAAAAATAAAAAFAVNKLIIRN